MTSDYQLISPKETTLSKPPNMSEWHIVKNDDFEVEEGFVFKYVCLSDEDDFTIIEQSSEFSSCNPQGSDKLSDEAYDRIPMFLRGDGPNDVKFDRFLTQYGTRRGIPKIQHINLRISDTSDQSCAASPLFSFDQSPTTWFKHMITSNAGFSIDIRIMQSVGQIYNKLLVPGIILVIIWANAMKGESAEELFWGKVEAAALNLLDDEAYLVHLSGDLKIFEGEVNSNQTRKMNEAGFRETAYCSITKAEGFESIEFEDGMALARRIQN